MQKNGLFLQRLMGSCGKKDVIPVAELSCAELYVQHSYNVETNAIIDLRGTDLS